MMPLSGVVAAAAGRGTIQQISVKYHNKDDITLKARLKIENYFKTWHLLPTRNFLTHFKKCLTFTITSL